MNDLILGIPVVVGTLLLVGLIFWLSHRKKLERERKLRELASLYGWSYEPVSERLASGYRIRKGEWMIEALTQTTDHSGDSTGSSNAMSSTRWISDAVRLKEGIVLIGPRQPSVNFGGVGEFLLQAALRLMIGAESDYALGIKEVEAGRMSLRERYMVWTNQEEEANRVLDAGVENALIKWPAKLLPIVKYSPVGIEIMLQTQRLEKPEEIIALVKLGEALLDSAV